MHVCRLATSVSPSHDVTDYLEDDGGLDMHCPSCDMARRLRGVAAKGNQFVLAYGGLGWAVRATALFVWKTPRLPIIGHSFRASNVVPLLSDHNSFGKPQDHGIPFFDLMVNTSARLKAEGIIVVGAQELTRLATEAGKARGPRRTRAVKTDDAAPPGSLKYITYYNVSRRWSCLRCVLSMSTRTGLSCSFGNRGVPTRT